MLPIRLSARKRHERKAGSTRTSKKQHREEGNTMRDKWILSGDAYLGAGLILLAIAVAIPTAS